MLRPKQKLGNEKVRLRRVFEMRCANIRPVRIAADTWHVKSLSREGVTHTVSVRLARSITHVDAIGAALDATCSCPATVECKHVLAVKMEYNCDLRLLLELEGETRAAA